jgi:hypothetical protein
MPTIAEISSTCVSRRCCTSVARRLDAGLDLGNILNTNYALTYENNYQYSVGNTAQGGTWNNPATLISPRFVRLNFTLDF